jgi:hypothetical protein
VALRARKAALRGKIRKEFFGHEEERKRFQLQRSIKRSAENKGFLRIEGRLAGKLTTLSIGRPMPPNVRGRGFERVPQLRQLDFVNFRRGENP